VFLSFWVLKFLKVNEIYIDFLKIVTLSFLHKELENSFMKYHFKEGLRFDKLQKPQFPTNNDFKFSKLASNVYHEVLKKCIMRVSPVLSFTWFSSKEASFYESNQPKCNFDPITYWMDCLKRWTKTPFFDLLL